MFATQVTLSPWWHNGSDALAEIARRKPDLVLLDVMLPDITGLEVCRRLRRNPDTVRLPVIMLTAKSEEVDRIVGFEVGAERLRDQAFQSTRACPSCGGDFAAQHR